MAKKKKNQQGGQQFLSPEKYLKERARTLEIGTCYINDDADEAGMAQIIVTRRHTGGRISMAAYLVDMLCLGVKDTYYQLRMDEEEFLELMDRQPLDFIECSYEEAHNRIYGAIAFAEEGGIEPHPDFRLTRYMLEEDTDDVPLIEYDYGRNGKHFLVCHSNLEASRYLPTLRKHLGDDFKYIIRDIDRDDFLDDDEEDYDDDDDEDDEEDVPVTIGDCIEEMDAIELHFMGLCLGLMVDEDISLEEMRQQYIDYILKNPEEVLMHLPHDDLCALAKLANEDEEERFIYYPKTSVSPIMYHLGLIDYDDTFDETECYRITEDFWEVARGLVAKVMDDDANKARLSVEGVVNGMANLYGYVRPQDIKHYISDLLEMPEDAADEMYGYIMTNSALIPYLFKPLDEEADVNDEDYENKILFCSRFGWETPGELVKAVSRSSTNITAHKDFSVEETMKAAMPVPVIPNSCQSEFTHFLRSRLGYGKVEAELICHRLWLRAQHEGDPENPYGTDIEYFTNEVLAKSENRDKKSQTSLLGEGMDLLEKYMNAMPRWTLKGHTKDEIKGN